MRLSRPLYEIIPLLYAVIGALAILLAYVDRDQPASFVALGIGICGEVAALTVFLRRQDLRALARDYSGAGILEAPPRSDG